MEGSQSAHVGTRVTTLCPPGTAHRTAIAEQHKRRASVETAERRDRGRGGERRSSANVPIEAARMVGSKESIKVVGRVESVDISDDMILVATFNLGGNTWDSSLQVLNFSTKEVVASVKQQSGCADVCWIKPGRRAVSAGDNGDVKVRAVGWI